MNKLFIKHLFGMAVVLLLSQFALAQTKISGTITDATTKEPLIGVSVQVKGKVIGTITDAKGAFAFSTTTPTPFTISISSVGYKSQEVTVSNAASAINVALQEQTIMGQEVVVAASRVEESVMQSPVTVEKMDLRAIRETPSASFYDGLANMKGIDMTTQSLLFKSVNMRGFGSTGNPRTVQMIDGMDNSAPGLNFPVDNIVGMPELDVESVEVLPGAASALYGPNAVNGIILMNSKSPFLYQGLSAAVKGGVMSEANRTTANTPFYDVALRYAKAFNNKFAFKVNFGLIEAKDWQSNNYTNLNVGGNADPKRGLGTKTDYDGANIYGDEVQAGMQTVANSLIAAKLLPSAALALIPNANVSRTGFIENSLVDNSVRSFKFNGALHYRLSEKVEAIAQLNHGLGRTLYTGTGKYGLYDFAMTQAKLELKGDNFMLRGYTTQENSGESYTAGLAAVAMLNEIKPHATWFGEYVGAFAQARGAGAAEEAAHIAARTFADRNMPLAGSTAFNTLRDKYQSTVISKGGGSFLDKTNLYHAEGTYNFKNQIKFVELLVGGNFRQYNLKSEGTLFADSKDGRTGSIAIQEYGAFAQAGKKLGQYLKLLASLRYDKSQNFDGQFSPRISAVGTFGDHNIRLSYQTGFRIPTTQNQYIDLQTPAGTLIGGLPEFDKRYNLGSGVSRETLVGFATNPAQYVTPAIIDKAKAYATAAVTAQLPAIQAGVTAAVQTQVTAGVTAAVTAQVTAGVTAAVNAAVAAGQLPAAGAPAAIQAGVAAQLATDAIKGAIAGGVTQQMATPGIQQAIATNVQSTLVSQITAVTTQVAPAFALATLPKYQAQKLRPERIISYELGYKGLISKKLFVDASYYYSRYKDFIGGTAVIVPTVPAGPGLPIESGLASGTTRSAYSRPANSNQDITVKGWSLSANYSLAKGYNIGANMANNELDGFTPSPEVQFAGFNTPKNRYNLSFGKRITSSSKWGFNMAFKHQDSFTWESGFQQPTTTGVQFYTNTIVPAVDNLDAQVSFKLSSVKSLVKIGATNLLNTPYIQAYGSPSIGSMYYISLNFDQLMN